MRTFNFFAGGVIQERTAIPLLPDTGLIPWWAYHIRHYLNDPRSQAHYVRDLTLFESLCTSTFMKRHLVSIIYKSLFSALSPKSDPACSFTMVKGGHRAAAHMQWFVNGSIHLQLSETSFINISYLSPWMVKISGKRWEMFQPYCPAIKEKVLNGTKNFKHSVPPGIN